MSKRGYGSIYLIGQTKLDDQIYNLIFILMENSSDLTENQEKLYISFLLVNQSYIFPFFFWSIEVIYFYM